MAGKSSLLFSEAKKYIPGGVNSPVRAYGSVGGVPPFIKKASGSKIIDVEGKEYIDYVCSWGPMILGHTPKEVIEQIKKVAENGTSFGAPTELEIELAKLITQVVPSVEMVRLVNSGTEATMSAIRLARGYTKREKIIKFSGCYHGHVDSLLVEAGSGVMTFGIPGSPGVPSDLAKLTISLPYNDLEKVKAVIESEGETIAAVILEPVAANMGVVLPKIEFLQGLRELTKKFGIVLIFDEVITGFRLGLGGAQEYYKISPALTCLGKIIGGGLPVGAYGGKREIMEHIAPLGPVYQAGTLSGNPLAMAAGIATIQALKTPGLYEKLEEKGAYLEKELKLVTVRRGVKVAFNRISSIFTGFFTEKSVVDYVSAKTSDTNKYARYFHRMLDKGIYLAPSQFEAGFISITHSQDDLDRTIQAVDSALTAL